MVIRARLSPPREERNDWPWHQARWTALSSELLMGGDRRMEAESYLAGGYGIRLSIEARKAGWTSMGDLADVWQPLRLKGIQVSSEYGTPFLAATQVFDLRPVPRKFLSLDRTSNAANRFVRPGLILVTCSGSVGRATLACKQHENVLVSHDLLRVEPRKENLWGWLYAYLRAPQTRAMMTSAQYGHVIKHLEVSHLNALPIPVLRDDLLAKFQTESQRVLELRSRAYTLMIDAEREYADYLGLFTIDNDYVLGFSTQASELFGKRRRLDGSCYVPSVRSINAAFQRKAKAVVPLHTLAERIFVPSRFKHVYGDGGSPYLDSADILEVNPDIAKYVLSLSHKAQAMYRVEAGWLIVPCSGQVYGNIGHSVLATEWHTNKVLTNHILRICPGKQVRSGYLQCVLGHPQLGRPRMVRFAFGSSVPEISAEDVATVLIPRFDTSIENRLADMMEESARARAEADLQEVAIATAAEAIIDRFIAGDMRDVVISPRTTASG